MYNSKEVSKEAIAMSLCVLTGIILICVYIPLLCYYGFKYWQKRNNIILQKRYCHITIYSVLLFIPKLIIREAMYFALLKESVTSLSYNTLVIMDDLIGIILYYLWLWRFWCIYFDTQWTICVLRRQWQCLINPKYSKSNRDGLWFISQRHKQGKSHWILLHVIVPLIVVSCVFMDFPTLWVFLIGDSDGYTSHNQWNMIHLCTSFVYFIPFLFLTVILLQMPTFHDEFHILTELKRIFVLLCIENVTNLSIFLIPSILYEVDGKQNEDRTFLLFKIIIPFIGFNIVLMAQFIALMIATKWVINKVNILTMNYDIHKRIMKVNRDLVTVRTSDDDDDDDYDNMNHTRKKSSKISYTISKQYSSMQNDTNNMNSMQKQKRDSLSVSVRVLKLQAHHNGNNNHRHSNPNSISSHKGTLDSYSDSNESVTLIRVLCDKDAFELFIKQLACEFSMECLLSLVEFTQYQQNIDAHITQTKMFETKKHTQSNLSLNSNNSSNSSNSNSQSTSPLYKLIEFPECVPLSSIVYNNYNSSDRSILTEKSKSKKRFMFDGSIDSEEFLRNSKLTAFALYRKYIAKGCGLEINVGWNIRKQLLNVMGNNAKFVFDISLCDQWDIDLHGLLLLFDECSYQMLRLMQESFQRFKLTKPFQKLRKKLLTI